MSTPDAPFYISAIALIVEILLSINNARIAKQGDKLNPVYGLLPAAAFIVFHAGWWMSDFRTPFAIVEYVIGSIASVAFLFGSAFVTTGCLAMTKGELCIDQENKVFKLFKRLPIEFEGKSLCSISWLAAILIFVTPIAVSVLGLFCAVISILICLWTWQNPIKYFSELMSLQGWPKTEIRSNAHGLWISPTPWLALLVVLAALITAVVTNLMSVVIGVGWCLAIGIVLCIFYYAFDWLGGYLFWQYEDMPEAQKQSLDPIVRKAYSKMDDEDHVRAFGIWVVFWQVFRQKFCPKVKFCSRNEMGATNCD